MTGKEAYVEDCRMNPTYHDGSKRKEWDQLDTVARLSWNRNPTPRGGKAHG